ncbi:hypothetical protein THII_3284 [Thioploca ingrica]|uniref:Secreted protein n=1 Tax=Thioploca ingrica TaxID=40754 RepID=A0A090BVW8_9GAMM|nr:hypothetical protein THII_3284 [Thioploca ingrica]
MKKTSLLLAIGALLYGASGSYALANINSGMTNAQILAVLQANGCIPAANAVDLTAEEVPPEDAVVDVTAAANQNPPPANIWVDDNDPVHMGKFCGFRPTGGTMADFPVSVNGGASSATFRNFSLSPNSGVAVGGGTPENGGGWLLFEKGDTWNNRWCLVTEMPITDITLDPLSRTGPGPEKYAFDIIYEPTHSDEFDGGSQRGWAVTGNARFTATYSRPVLVDSHPNDLHAPYPDNLKTRYMANPNTTHDMYGTLKIKFEAPALGQVDLPALFTYRADTDCLPVKEGQVVSYNPETSTLVMNILAENGGLAAIVQRCDDDISVADTFDLTGNDTITTSLQFESGCCYSLVNADTLETVKLLGVNTNANNEVCP